MHPDDIRHHNLRIIWYRCTIFSATLEIFWLIIKGTIQCYGSLFLPQFSRKDQLGCLQKFLVCLQFFGDCWNLKGFFGYVTLDFSKVFLRGTCGYFRGSWGIFSEFPGRVLIFRVYGDFLLFGFLHRRLIFLKCVCIWCSGLSQGVVGFSRVCL